MTTVKMSSAFRQLLTLLRRGPTTAPPSHTQGSPCPASEVMADGDPQLSLQRGAFLHRPRAQKLALGRGAASLVLAWFCGSYLTSDSNFWDANLHKQLCFQPCYLPPFGLYSSSAKRLLFLVYNQDPLSLSLSLSSTWAPPAPPNKHRTKSKSGELCKPGILSFHLPQAPSVGSSGQMGDLVPRLPEAPGSGVWFPSLFHRM